jgi:hypothetical protein
VASAPVVSTRLGQKEGTACRTDTDTRRDFLKLSGLGLGGAALASCGRAASVVKVTAVPPPSGQQGAPAPTLAPTEAPIPVGPLAAGETADTVLVNGNIVTMDAQRSKVKALAIKDGLIRLVGDEQPARAAVGGSSQIIDLHGRTVTPGIIDAHCHVSSCGLLGTVYVDISWPGINTVEQMQAKMAEKINQTPAVNGCWAEDG